MCSDKGICTVTLLLLLQGDLVYKNVFIVFFQGDQLKARVKKIAEGYVCRWIIVSSLLLLLHEVLANQQLFFGCITSK